MSSIFTKIINGDIPCYKVAEDDHCIAFLDINPLVAGHTLVVPKVEIDYLFDLESSTYAQLFDFAKKVAPAIERVVTCDRIGVSVIGLEVPHAHIHLIPINSVYDMDFSKPRVQLTQEQFTDLADRIGSFVAM